MTQPSRWMCRRVLQLSGEGPCKAELRACLSGCGFGSQQLPCVVCGMGCYRVSDVLSDGTLLPCRDAYFSCLLGLQRVAPLQHLLHCFTLVGCGKDQGCAAVCRAAAAVAAGPSASLTSLHGPAFQPCPKLRRSLPWLLRLLACRTDVFMHTLIGGADTGMIDVGLMWLALRRDSPLTPVPATPKCAAAARLLVPGFPRPCLSATGTSRAPAADGCSAHGRARVMQC